MQLKKLEPGGFSRDAFSLSLPHSGSHGHWRHAAELATPMPPSGPSLPCPLVDEHSHLPPLFPSPFSGSKPPPFSLAAAVEPTSSSSNRRQLKPRRSEPRSPSAPPHRRLPPHRRNRAGRPDVNVGVLDVVHLGRRPPGANTGRFRRPRLPLAAPALPINSG